MCIVDRLEGMEDEDELVVSRAGSALTDIEGRSRQTLPVHTV